VANDLTCLRLPIAYPGTPSVNCYLAGRTLIDCGSAAGAGWPALERALGHAGVRPHEIERLVLTHLHPDHAGLAAELAARSGCEVVRLAGPGTSNDALRERTLSYEARRRRARRAGVPAAEVDLMLEAHVAGDNRPPQVEADRLVEPGDELDGWRVIDATGHSANQLALFDGETIIAADAAYPEIMPFIEWGHTPDPWGEYLATLDRIEALAPRLYLPGHGRPDPAPAARLASARAVLERFLAELPGGDTPYEITLKIAGGDADPNRRQATLAVVLSALQHRSASRP
jgi:glyoxylase-like metal-dependent hydrolase (beta-lactamase superfamily II)